MAASVACLAELPLAGLLAGKLELPLKSLALELEQYEVGVVFEELVGSAIDDFDVAEAFVDAAFVGKELEGVVEDSDGRSRLVCEPVRRQLKAICLQEAFVSQHKVPVSRLVLPAVFVDDELSGGRFHTGFWGRWAAGLCEAAAKAAGRDHKAKSGDPRVCTPGL